MTGCRARVVGGDARMVSRCMPSNVGAFVDGNEVTAKADELSDYSECPEGHTAIGLGYINMGSGVQSQLNIQDCCMTGCRVWPRGGDATFRSRCVSNMAGNFTEGALVTSLTICLHL